MESGYRFYVARFGVCRKEDFLCANSVMLCVSVVKLLRKTFTTEAGEVTQRTTETDFFRQAPKRATGKLQNLNDKQLKPPSIF
jgi:hypothetical protein